MSCILQDGHIVARQAIHHRFEEIFQGRGVTGNVDKDHVMPYCRSDPKQIGTATIRDALVVIGSAKVRSTTQITARIIGPGVIGAGDQGFPATGLREQSRTTMTADVLKSAHFTIVTAH